MILHLEVEVYTREFKARLLLAAEAALKGFTVFLLSRQETLNLLNQNKLLPGIYHLKDANCSKFNIEFYKKLKSLGCLITTQDEEAGIMYDDYYEFIKRRFSSSESLNYIEKFFCFGRRDFEVLNKKFEKKIFYRTGSPRFDLCSQNFYEKKSSFLKKKNLRNFILISSSIQYPISFRSLASQYDIRINPDSEKEEFLLYKEKNFFQKFRQNLEQIPFFIKLIIYLSENLIGHDIVVRPHPNEDIETWNKLLKRTKSTNIKIIKDETLSEFINFSECLIQSGCTSAIEAFVNKKKVISFVPTIYEDNFDSEFVNSLGIKASKNEEVLNLIRDNFKHTYKIEKNEFDYRIDLIIDKKLSFENIVDHFCKINFNKDIKNYNSFNKLETYALFINYFRKIKKILNKRQIIKFTKFPDFKHEFIKKDLADFQRFDSKFKNVSFKILTNKILKVYSIG